MKKILLMSILIILIPYLIVTFFIKDEEIKFYYSSNMSVRVKRTSTGEIESVPFEEYVVGVLAGEMPVSFELEALKAQAVAARTYVMKRMQDNYKEKYDVVDTVMNQVYISDSELQKKWGTNYDKYINKLKQAVIETKGEYLVYDNKVIDALFFSTSVGKTENSEDIFPNAVPYLRSVESMWDQTASPVFNDFFEFSLQEFYDRLGLKYDSNLNIKVTKTTSTGRIKNITINGKSFTGGTVANKLGLRSSFFEIEKNGKNIKITTTGYGHGVGMSQYGANGMAKEGYNYNDILTHYYKDIQIKKI